MFNDYKKNPFPLLEYFNIFSFNDFMLELNKEDERAVFELTMREPSPESKWEYFVFFGIKEFVDTVSKWNFDEDMIVALNKSGYATTEKQKEFYRNWEPKLDIYSIADGDLFFKGEPILRIEGDILSVNLLTHLCLSFFQYPIRLATKNLRIKNASNNKGVYYGGGRCQSRDDIYWFNKLTHPLCNNDIVYPSIFTQYPNLDKPDLKVVNLNHAFIKSFDTEKEAFTFGLDKINDFDVFTIMTDTYDYRNGLDNLIGIIFDKKIHLEKGLLSKIYVIIDSGNILEQSKYIRAKLDENNLQLANIVAMSGLDEDDLIALESEGSKANAYSVVTNLINCYGCSYLDFVFKTSLVIDKEGNEHLKAKLTEGKESLPGRKNIERVINDGVIVDTIVMEDNSGNGNFLLKPVMKNGESLLPDEETLLREYSAKLKEFSKHIRKNNRVEHRVVVEDAIKEQIEELKKKHGTI
ncbi:MAG: Nicotinate phosphoribosyltransferase [Candidatus Wolfebacteria bacterium GW2011_GWE1_48_7]|nr:MAG: Nicotinate phosphoribosyltransferase [Candidatus Wolfebacteria bacterium GW2011_GWC2_46_275]KKU41973.1 MAG: Nicotinate phosphoribosyltransferase [Candidatus Wolfebacteria bacterium GW2011_GWB2_46_69]KKU54491.1 MAG: Nicotinate phosphoribosyltransferase [Candidatus Wolfebacteria bacterium GW2011_GWC1_47_103]KKU59818.1 MAG: Nicotinate phosphoribosyltransferase [Candidatus Wolfebacteria bacterium GW2011_GWE2_47_12]KKU65811.1 MAG: Nicotinate phosphoribosyltransferase [Candidatus Wolfebacteri